MRRIALIAATLTALAAPALGQSYYPYDPYGNPRVDQRQANQAQRIYRNQYYGNLSPREADRLWRGQQRIDRMERRFASDGYLSPRERRMLDDAQDRQSRRIARQSHDRNGR